MQWINFETEKPKKGGYYLIIFKMQDERIITKANYDEEDESFNLKASHWMELPELPNELHECCYKGAEWKRCYQSGDTFLFMPMKGCFIAVKYCPLCGEKAPNADIFDDEDQTDDQEDS